MKKIILIILALGFSIFGNIFAEIKPFTALELADFKNEIKNSIVIDIRTPQEISLGKISEDALEIDYYSKDFKEKLNKLDKEKQYLIYCAHGNRTRDTKIIMKNLGFSKVYDLDGGIVKWDEGLKGGPDRKEVVEKYLGKPTVVLIAGTFCPHCQKDIPEVEKKIFDKVGDQINLIVNVTDGAEGKRFETDMKQISDPLLGFKTLTGEECAYVPTWVILDKNGETLEKSCGNDKGTDGIISTLKSLGITFDKVNTEKEKNDNLNIWILILGFLAVIGGGYWAFKK